MAKEQIEWLAADELTPHPKNPKKHPKKQIDFLMKSLDTYKFTKPILYVEHDGLKVIIAGHGIVEAARKKKMKVMALKSDMDYETATKYLLADNKSSELSAYDDDLLKDVLQSIPITEIDQTGFTALLETESNFTLEDFEFDNVKTPIWWVIRADLSEYTKIQKSLMKLKAKGLHIEDSQEGKYA